MTAAEDRSSPGEGRIWRALSVLPDERPKVLWTGAMFFVLLASASIGLNAADTLFFLRFGVESLPWMIMFSGLAVMIVTIGHAAALAEFGVRLWSWAITVVFAVWLAAERLAIAVDMPGIYPAVWLTGQVVVYVGFTVLWDVAGEMADARQAKRLFPLFMSAGIAGAVTGNALTGPLAGLLGTENLLIVEAIGLGLAGAITRVAARRFVHRRETETPNVIHDLRSGFETTVRVPLFRLVAGVGAALSVLFFLVFFPFSEIAASSFETEESLAAFLGWFSSAATAATFLVSLLVAKRLFTRLGVVAVLLIVALVYVGGFSLWLVAFGLVTATIFRGIQWVAINALAATAFSSLFNVLTGSARAQTRDFVAAVPVQIGTIIAGALLLAGSALSGTARTVVSLSLAVAFLLMVLPMRKAYSAALVDAVRHGLSDVFTTPMRGLQKPHCDKDSLAALLEGAADSSPARRRVSAAILGQVGGDAANESLRGLLDDEDSAVRLEALRNLANSSLDTVGDEVVRLVADPAPPVRRCAIALLQSSHAGSPQVRAALEDEDVEVRAHAARIVGGPVGSNLIEDMLHSNDSAAVAAALECVVAQPDLAPVDARQFADHEDARVRVHAAGLLALRSDSVPRLRRLTNDRSPEVRLAAARGLQRVDRDTLHDVLRHGSVRAREAALESLVSTEVRDPYLAEWAADELDRAGELHRHRIAIETRVDGGSVAAEYLARVLEKREHMVERWVITALGTDATQAAIPLIARGAISGDPNVRAEALEAIESVADRRMGRRLVTILEGATDHEAPTRLQALQGLAADHQPWLRALAFRALLEEFRNDLGASAAAAANDESPVVRTAIPPVDAVLPETAADGLTLLDSVLALQKASLFEHLDPEELEALAEVSRERRWDPGTLVFDQGDVGDELIMIVSGTAVVRIQQMGAYRELVTRGAGEPIGELAVLRRRPRMAQVIAGDDGLHAVTIAGNDLVTALEQHPGIATALLAKLADRIAGRVDVAGPSALPLSS